MNDTQPIGLRKIVRRSNVVGIPYPLILIGLTYLPKSGGRSSPPVPIPLQLRRHRSDVLTYCDVECQNDVSIEHS